MALSAETAAEGVTAADCAGVKPAVFEAQGG